MKRCYLHIGMHKTGSPSIQSNLAAVENPSKWTLLRVGRSPNMGEALHAMFAKAPHTFRAFARRGETADQVAKYGATLRDQLEKELRDNDKETVIISAEALLTIDPTGITALRDFLLRFFDEIKVIGYVRAPISYKTSFYQQRLKDFPLDKFDVAGMRMHYRKRFQKFDAVFGMENVSLRKFDTAAFPSRSVVQDFCQQTGIVDGLDVASMRHVSESLSREACGILLAYRKFGSGFGTGKKVLAENKMLLVPLVAMSGDPLKIAAPVFEESRIEEAEDMQWMETRLGQSLAEVIEDGGSGVQNEADLLTIRAAACDEFATKFREIYHREIPEALVPTENPADPRAVANMVEHARSILREQEEEVARKRWARSATPGRGKEGAEPRPVKRGFVHIGMPKTGSSSIQSNLSQFDGPRDWKFMQVGGGPNMGESMHAMFATEPHKFHSFVKLGHEPEKVAAYGAKLRKKLEKQIRSCGKDTVILSAEALPSVDEAGIQALYDFLEPLCDEVRVIGYVRPPIAYKISSYQQRLKQHGIRKFDIVQMKMNFRARFEKFDKVFGRTNVNLRKFDPAAFPGKCIVADFCRELDIVGPDPSTITRANESITREACAILFAYRKFGTGYGKGSTVIKENQKIVIALRKLGGSKFKVSKALISKGLGREKGDIKWMEKRLGLSLKEVIDDDGSEIASEEDLLKVSRSACEEFVQIFSEDQAVKVPKEMIPKSDPVPPEEAARLIEYCRGQVRGKIARRKRRQELSRFIPSPLRKIWKFAKRTLSGTSHQPA